MAIDTEQHLLYDTALEEVVQALGAVASSKAVRVDQVRELMVLSWLRGSTWSIENAAAAGEAYVEYGKRLLKDSPKV